MRRFGFVTVVTVILGIAVSAVPAGAQMALKHSTRSTVKASIEDCMDVIRRSGLLRIVYVRAVFDAEGKAVEAYAAGDPVNGPATLAFAAASVKSGMRITPSESEEARRELLVPVSILVSFGTPEQK